MFKPELLACTLVVGVQHSNKYTITAWWVKMIFYAQKGHKCMMITFSKVVLYGNDIR